MEHTYSLRRSSVLGQGTGSTLSGLIIDSSGVAVPSVAVTARDIFYTLFERFGSENQLSLNPPYLINNTPAVASNATAPVFFLRNGFPSNFLDPAALNYKLVRIRAVNPNLPPPSVQQWSL